MDAAVVKEYINLKNPVDYTPVIVSVYPERNFAGLDQRYWFVDKTNVCFILRIVGSPSTRPGGKLRTTTRT